MLLAEIQGKYTIFDGSTVNATPAAVIARCFMRAGLGIRDNIFGQEKYMEAARFFNANFIAFILVHYICKQSVI